MQAMQTEAMACSKAQINFSELTHFDFMESKIQDIDRDKYTFSTPQSVKFKWAIKCGNFSNNHLQNAFHLVHVIFFSLLSLYFNVEKSICFVSFHSTQNFAVAYFFSLA